MKLSLKTKVICAVLFMALALALTAGLISYNVYSRSMERHYEELTFNTAKSAASMLDADAIAELAARTLEIYRSLCPDEQTPPDFDSFDEADWAEYYAAYDEITSSPEYKQAFATLNALKEDNGVLYMYVAYMDVQTGQGIYIIDADSTENACPTGTCGDIEAGNLELIQQGIYDFPPYITNYPEFGWLSSAAAAIYDSDGKVIANAFVDFSMNQVMADQQNFLVQLGVILVAATVLLIALLTFAFTRTVVRPINQLAAATSSFVSEKQQDRTDSAISKLDIHTGDEIEYLCNSVRQMEQEIDSYISDLTHVTAERERIGAELDVAKNIQASMLPCIFPPFPQCSHVDIYATMNPAKEVGGDFYDFFLVDEDHLALVIADVSGKGVPAAMFMVIAKTLIKNSAQTGLSPREVLEKVNNQLCENNDAEMFVTVWIGILTISTGHMVCANAGHECPALLHAGGQFELFKDKHGFVLAGIEDSRYREYELNLQNGDMLFVYTDGVTDATNSQNELFGLDRMIDALNNGDNSSCEQLLQDVRAEIDRFVGDAPQFDDITMLSIRIKDDGDALMQWLTLKPELSNLERATEFYEEKLSESGAPVRVVAQVNVIIDEMFSNIVHYSGADEVKLGCLIDGTQLKICLRDNGTPFDPTQRPDVDVSIPLNERKIGGMGIYIVKKSVDSMEYKYADGYNELTLKKSW